MFANNHFSGQPMTGAGSYGENNPYGSALRPVPEPVSEPEPQVEQEAGGETDEQVDSGTLMSFLTDFRTAQYEEIRRQRMEALEKSRKGRAPRPVPPVEGVEEADDGVDGSYQATYEGDELPAESQWAPPPAEYPVEGQPEVRGLDRDTERDAGLQVAACKPEEPAGKKRFRLGLPSFKDLGQSPATA